MAKTTEEIAADSLREQKQLLPDSWSKDRDNVAIWLAPVGMLIAVLAIMVSTLNRGFATADSAWYALMFERPYQYPFYSDFALVLRAFPIFNSCAILQLRIVALILIFVSSIVFTFGLLKWWEQALNRHRLPLGIWLGAISSTVAGGLLSGRAQLASGYNTVSSCLLMTACGAYFYALQSSKIVRAWLLPLVGLIVGLSMFVKFSSALILLTLLLLMTWWQDKQRFSAAVLMIGGFVAGIAAYFVLFRSVDSWLAGPWWSIAETSACGHQIRSVLTPQIKSLGHAAIAIVPSALLLFGCLTLCRLAKDKFSHSRKQTLLVRCGGAVLIMASLLCVLLFSSSYFFWSVVVALVLFLTQYCRNNNLKLQYEVFAGLAFLCILPLVFSLGTSTPDLLLHAVLNLAPGWLFLFLLCTLIQPRDLSLSLICAIPIVVFPVFLHTYWHSSYPPTTASLAMQTQTSNLPKLKGVLIEPSQKNFLEQSYSLLRSGGFRSGDRLLCPDSFLTGGILYAFDAVAPGLPYTYQAELANASLVDRFLEQTKDKRFYVAACSNNKEHMPPEIDRVLTKNGIAFPSDFHYLGSIRNAVFMPEGETQYWKYPKQ